MGCYLQTEIMYRLDGLLDEFDLTRHFTDEFIKHASNGTRVNYYQGWGDSRRSTTLQATAGVSYNKLYTTESDGLQGRLRANMISSNSYNLQYDSTLRRRIRVNHVLESL